MSSLFILFKNKKWRTHERCYFWNLPNGSFLMCLYLLKRYDLPVKFEPLGVRHESSARWENRSGVSRVMSLEKILRCLSHQYNRTWRGGEGGREGTRSLSIKKCAFEYWLHLPIWWVFLSLYRGVTPFSKPRDPERWGGVTYWVRALYHLRIFILPYLFEFSALRWQRVIYLDRHLAMRITP